MKWLFRTVIFLLLFFLVIWVSLGASYALPYPWSRINIMYTVIMFLIAFRPRGSIVWVSFFAHFFLELFAVTPFGILLLSGTLSTLFAYWAYQNIFSNRSWFAMVALSSLTLLTYRILYFIFLYSVHIVHSPTIVSFSSIAITTGWEILCTTSLIGVVYGLFFLRRGKKIDVRLYG